MMKIENGIPISSHENENELDYETDRNKNLSLVRI